MCQDWECESAIEVYFIITAWCKLGYKYTPVALPPITVSCKNPLLEIIITGETPLVFSITRMRVPTHRFISFICTSFWLWWWELKWHSPVWNVCMGCLHCVSDLLIKLLNLLPHNLEMFRFSKVSKSMSYSVLLFITWKFSLKACQGRVFISCSICCFTCFWQTKQC